MSPLGNRERALLNTIRFAEGTWTGGKKDGYRMMFGGRLADPARSGGRHPARVINGVSDATGAYQFLSTTAAEALKAIGARPDQFFDPDVQDRAAWHLAQRRLGKTALGDTLTPEVAGKLAPEWASFPTASGASYYPNQSVKKLSELQQFYSQQLKALNGGKPPAPGRGSDGGGGGGGMAAAPTAGEPLASAPPQAGAPTPAVASPSSTLAKLDVEELFRGPLQQAQQQGRALENWISNTRAIRRGESRMAGSQGFLQQAIELGGQLAMLL
ncbi:MAG: hypothetical protein VKK97_10935 [Synechococcaceae cyanobacterium]|nr:hypothetical protein [Synechococcaceae cyanobacterium]